MAKDPPSIGPSPLHPFGGPDVLHALIDTVPDAMVVIDTSGNILSFSTGAELMFGYSEAEVLGENVSLLMPSPDRERHDGYLRQYMETGKRRVIGIGRVTTARARDGATFPIDLSVGEVNLADKRLFAGFIRDLTDSRQTEQQLHSLQAELAHVSRISSMGTLATSIAHELNQPLTAIANYVEGAQDLLDEPSAHNIDQVRYALRESADEALRAGQIVQRLREFIARGETTRTFASISKLVNEATALALINGDARGVEFEQALSDEEDKVLVDPVQIQQVLVNLIRNAVEAMSESTIKRLFISSHLNSDGMMVVTVSDSGPGLDEHVAERLFHPFVSTKASGMGLGLSIAHTIINAHDGKIWAEPSPLGGTQFHFSLVTQRTLPDDD